MPSIKPYYGQVFLTDYNTKYPDASDHNAEYARLTINDGEPDETGAQVMTFNVRRYGFDQPPYDWDTHRDSRCAHLIADSGASVLALQECDHEQDTYLYGKLPQLTGVPWTAVSSPTNVGLMFKADRWRLLTWRNLLMDNGSETDRRLVLALLQSIRTGGAAWFGSTHFGVGPDLAKWRVYQAQQVCKYLLDMQPRPGEETIELKYFGDIRKRAVIMGDFNDWAPPGEIGVRHTFSGYGFRELRGSRGGPLTDAQMHGDNYSTKHSFGKLTPHDGRQIDAIFTQR
jgi:endonuclease/exonuclease/phosphatase family metal-dependent hydrolase